MRETTIREALAKAQIILDEKRTPAPVATATISVVPGQSGVLCPVSDPVTVVVGRAHAFPRAVRLRRLRFHRVGEWRFAGLFIGSWYHFPNAPTESAAIPLLDVVELDLDCPATCNITINVINDNVATLGAAILSGSINTLGAAFGYGSTTQQLAQTIKVEVEAEEYDDDVNRVRRAAEILKRMEGLYDDLNALGKKTFGMLDIVLEYQEPKPKTTASIDDETVREAVEGTLGELRLHDDDHFCRHRMLPLVQKRLEDLLGQLPPRPQEEVEQRVFDATANIVAWANNGTESQAVVDSYGNPLPPPDELSEE